MTEDLAFGCGNNEKNRASNIVWDCFDLSGKGVALCKGFLQANLDLFVRLIYQAIILIHSKYLLSEAVAGYAFYLIASNFANIQVFSFTEHITQGAQCGDRSTTSNAPSASVSHQMYLSCCNFVSLSKLSFVLMTTYNVSWFQEQAASASEMVFH